jgi:hypothetical protein
MCNGKVFGYYVSAYGKQKGYLDYRTLANMMEDLVPNNSIRAATMEDWKLVSGTLKEAVQQDYIITPFGYELLAKYTDELVFYNEQLDMYIWAATQLDRGWAYVLTDVELIDISEDNPRESLHYSEPYINHIYTVVLLESDSMDAIYGDYIKKLVGVFGLNALLDCKLLESCGTVNGRKLYTLLNKI